MADHDIRDRTDIARLVTEFYRRAFADDLLGPIFVDIARMDLAAHLPIMCDFWETVLLRAGTYRRNAFTVHVGLHQRAELGADGLTAEMFARWLALWSATVDDLFTGPVAEHANLQATRIGASIHRRLHASRDRQPLSIGDLSPGCEPPASEKIINRLSGVRARSVSAGTTGADDRAVLGVAQATPTTWSVES